MIEIPFTDSEWSIIYQALILHEESKRLSCSSLREAASDMRNGFQYPLFADGEDGAVAADRTADWIEYDMKVINEMLSKIEDYRFGDQDDD